MTREKFIRFQTNLLEYYFVVFKINDVLLIPCCTPNIKTKSVIFHPLKKQTSIFEY